MTVAVAVTVGGAVTVGVGVRPVVTVALGVVVTVAVGVTVSVGVVVMVALGVSVALGVGVTVRVGVTVGVGDGVAVGVLVTVGVGVGGTGGSYTWMKSSSATSPAVAITQVPSSATVAPQLVSWVASIWLVQTPVSAPSALASVFATLPFRSALLQSVAPVVGGLPLSFAY